MHLAKTAFMYTVLGKWVPCQRKKVRLWVHMDATDSFKNFRKTSAFKFPSLVESVDRNAANFDYGFSYFGDRGSGGNQCSLYQGYYDFDECQTRKTNWLPTNVRDNSLNGGSDDEEDALSGLPYLATHKFKNPSGDNELNVLFIVTDYPPKYDNNTYNTPEHHGGTRSCTWNADDGEYCGPQAESFSYYSLDTIFNPLKKKGIVPVSVTLDGPNTRKTGSAYDAFRHIFTSAGLSPDENKSFTLRGDPAADPQKIINEMANLVNSLKCWVPDPLTTTTTTTTRRTTTTTTTTTTKTTTTTRRPITTTTPKITTTSSSTTTLPVTTTTMSTTTSTSTKKQTTVPCKSTTLATIAETGENPGKSNTKVVVASAMGGLATIGIISGIMWARRPQPALSAEMSDMYEEEEDGEYTLREAAVDMDEEAFA